MENNVPQSNPGKGMGIASMIMGIVAVICNTVCSCSFGPMLGGPLSIVGLILAIVAKKKSKAAGCSNGMATVGLIASIAAIVCGIIAAIVLSLGLIGSMASGAMGA